MMARRPAMFNVRAKTLTIAFGAEEEDGKKQNVCLDGKSEQLH
jgi:hypothetical protein